MYALPQKHASCARVHASAGAGWGGHPVPQECCPQVHGGGHSRQGGGEGCPAACSGHLAAGACFWRVPLLLCLLWPPCCRCMPVVRASPSLCFGQVRFFKTYFANLQISTRHKHGCYVGRQQAFLPSTLTPHSAYSVAR